MAIEINLYIPTVSLPISFKIGKGESASFLITCQLSFMTFFFLLKIQTPNECLVYACLPGKRSLPPTQFYLQSVIQKVPTIISQSYTWVEDFSYGFLVLVRKLCFTPSSKSIDHYLFSGIVLYLGTKEHAIEHIHVFGGDANYGIFGFLINSFYSNYF